MLKKRILSPVFAGLLFFSLLAAPALYAEGTAGGPAPELDAAAEAMLPYSGVIARYFAGDRARPAERRFAADAVFFLIAALVLLCGLGLAFAIRGIRHIIADGVAVKVETAAIFTGALMPLEKKKRMAGVKTRRAGLRFKLAAFTLALALALVIMVLTPFYYMMSSTRQEAVLKGLWDRCGVLLEGLASAGSMYLSIQNPESELNSLLVQTELVPEARYITITGYGSGSSAHNDCVWASSDPDILSKIDTAELRPGVSRIQDELSGLLVEIGNELNARARSEAELSRNIEELEREWAAVALRSDEASRRRLHDIQVTIGSLQTSIGAALSDSGKRIYSQPEFSTDRIPAGLNSTFILFKPLMFRQGSDDNYFRGCIRLEISIDSIREQFQSWQRRLHMCIMIIACIAITIGIIGAFIFSTLLIRPIRALTGHVERIRDTGDKSKLAGIEIHISTNDEIAGLGNSINEMTRGLVKDAMAASELSIGPAREIQKKFIPLDTDREGNKLTSGFKDAKNAQFFGYYEGAKGMSGDYFDYYDLDGRYYAIIKCDAAGKGIPAALIMIQVATMFLNYFKQWKPSAKGMHIEKLVYQINEFIETLGFKGRFAAFTLCIFDSMTGLARFCNAGDNIIHFFDSSEGKVKALTLPQTPAAGALPNSLVESKGGYSVQTMTIDHGDILFMYTDGIEESKRKFRDAEFREIICAEGPADTPHGNHVSGQGTEEMGPGRVKDIINAVMNRQVYALRKWHNGEGDNELKFDFSACNGRVDEVIMALVSVEKMFRCFKSPKANEDSRIPVDKKVDEFLKKHFIQYRTYCALTRDYPGSEAYVYYTHVNEDEQYDDLTILGMKRK